MVEVSAAEFGELCAVHVEGVARREGRSEIDVYKADLEEIAPSLAGQDDLRRVVLKKPEGRESCGSKTLDLDHLSQALRFEAQHVRLRLR